MKGPGTSIKRKIMSAVMISSITVLLFAVAAFMAYDLATFRTAMVQHLSTVARVIAANSSAAIAFKNKKDAGETLSSLRVEPQISAAALYDVDGRIFMVYPVGISTNKFPRTPTVGMHHFGYHELELFEPVTEDQNRLGMLYVQANLNVFYQRLKVYAIISALIVLGSLTVVLVLSNRLQQRISDPILELAGTARRISERSDYSARATKSSDDELGVLTEAFNQMLTRIQEQTIAIQESAERLRLAMRASGTGSWNWNLETGHIQWDEYTHALYGLNPDGFKGTFDHFLQIIHPEDRAAIQNAVTESIGGRKDFVAEFRVVWPDGSTHELLARGTTFTNPAGRPVRMTGVNQDITARKHSEAASRLLAALVQSSDDAIISKDLDNIITSWNTGAEKLLQYSAEEMIGKPITSVIPRERHEEEQSILDRIRHGEATQHLETLRQRKDGSIVQISLTASPVKNSDGKIIGASTIARDITESIRTRDALENQARILREQAQMLDLANVMGRGLDDRIFLWNTGMEKMYGWLRTETIGRSSHEVLKTRFPQPLEEILEDLKRDGTWEGELVHTRKDGRVITVASQWVLHKDDHGRPTAILEVNTDITERKGAEEAMLRMNVELERRVKERTAELTSANQELEAFTYSVAHDLRAPLRHIDAFTKIIFDDFAPTLPDEAKRYLDNIRKGSQNMSHLVDDLLNLARVSRQELKRELTPLNNVVDEVLGELKRETENRQVEWEIEPLPTVESDPGLIKQVFANLLSNAIKYTRPREKAVIHIGQRQMQGETVIYVRDNGVGFNMKYADKLFGVFQRLHRADEFEGTGVGLATVERIVRKHGGRIWAQAEVDKGATFYLSFNGVNKKAATPPTPAHTQTK